MSIKNSKCPKYGVHNSMLNGFSGFILAARVGSVNHMNGANSELAAILACMIGGVSVAGGIGKIRGVLIGVSLLVLLSISISWLSTPIHMQYILIGTLVLFAAVTNKKRYSTTVR